MAINRQGRRDEAAAIGARLMSTIDQVRAQGFGNSVMLLIESYLKHLAGGTASIETAMTAAIEQGWRGNGPAMLN